MDILLAMAFGVLLTSMLALSHWVRQRKLKSDLASVRA